MKLVFLESPFSGPDQETIERNIRYARACMRYCLLNGAAPYVSHLLYTQPGVLDDEDPEERRAGIDAGQLFKPHTEATWVFLDLGCSAGMQYGIDQDRKTGRVVVEMRLGPDWEREWLGPTKARTFV